MGSRKKHPDTTDPEELKKLEELRYQTYIDERKILVEGEQTSADQLDKNILALAGGALGLSIVFLEKIAPNPLPSTLIFLRLSWAFLTLSLLAMLFSFMTSQSAYRQQVKILEADMFPEDNSEISRKNSWSLATKALNISSILCFVVGVILLGYFSIQNVKVPTDKKTEMKLATSTIP